MQVRISVSAILNLVYLIMLQTHSVLVQLELHTLSMEFLRFAQPLLTAVQHYSAVCIVERWGNPTAVQQTLSLVRPLQLYCKCSTGMTNICWLCLDT